MPLSRAEPFQTAFERTFPTPLFLFGTVVIPLAGNAEIGGRYTMSYMVRLVYLLCPQRGAGFGCTHTYTYDATPRGGGVMPSGFEKQRFYNTLDHAVEGRADTNEFTQADFTFFSRAFAPSGGSLFTHNQSEPTTTLLVYLEQKTNNCSRP